MMGQVTLKDLIDGNCLDFSSVQDLQRGLISLEQIEDKMKEYLFGKPVVVGFSIQHGTTDEVITIQEAFLRGLIKYDAALYLLEAQAATGKQASKQTCK